LTETGLQLTQTPVIHSVAPTPKTAGFIVKYPAGRCGSDPRLDFALGSRNSDHTQMIFLFLYKLNNARIIPRMISIHWDHFGFPLSNISAMAF